MWTGRPSATRWVAWTTSPPRRAASPPQASRAPRRRVQRPSFSSDSTAERLGLPRNASPIPSTSQRACLSWFGAQTWVLNLAFSVTTGQVRRGRSLNTALAERFSFCAVAGHGARGDGQAQGAHQGTGRAGPSRPILLPSPLLPSLTPPILPQLLLQIELARGFLECLLERSYSTNIYYTNAGDAACYTVHVLTPRFLFLFFLRPPWPCPARR